MDGVERPLPGKGVQGLVLAVTRSPQGRCILNFTFTVRDLSEGL